MSSASAAAAAPPSLTSPLTISKKSSSGRRQRGGSSTSRPAAAAGSSATSGVDPFTHVALVHGFVDALNEACLSMRFLICLRDQLPFVGIERGCDIISDFARRHLLRKTRHSCQPHASEDRVRTGCMLLFRLAFLRLRKRVRGKKKLTALILRYARERRDDLATFVTAWADVEHRARGQSLPSVSFLEYATAHVAAVDKPRIAAAVRATFVHRWVKELRQHWAKRLQQSDHFFLYMARSHVTIPPYAYYALKSMLLGLLPVQSDGPRFRFFTATIGDVVLEEARRRFGPVNASSSGGTRRTSGGGRPVSTQNLRVSVAGAASLVGPQQADAALLRRLVAMRTQRDSCTNPDLLVNSAYIHFPIVHRLDDPRYVPRVRSCFMQPPPELHVASFAAGTSFERKKPQPTTDAAPIQRQSSRVTFSSEPGENTNSLTQSARRQGNDEVNDANGSGSTSPSTWRRSTGPPGSPTTVTSPTSLQHVNSSRKYIAVNRTVISMVGTRWLDHPIFQGTLRRVEVEPQEAGEVDEGEAMMELDRRDDGCRRIGLWKPLVASYELEWSRIRSASLRPKPKHEPKAPPSPRPLDHHNLVDEKHTTKPLTARRPSTAAHHQLASTVAGRSNRCSETKQQGAPRRPSSSSCCRPADGSVEPPLCSAIATTMKLCSRPQKPSQSHSRFYGTHGPLAFPALKALGVLEVPVADVGPHSAAAEGTVPHSDAADGR